MSRYIAIYICRTLPEATLADCITFNFRKHPLMPPLTDKTSRIALAKLPLIGEEAQIIRVVGIALDNQKLEQKARDLVRFVEAAHNVVFLIVQVRRPYHRRWRNNREALLKDRSVRLRYTCQDTQRRWTSQNL
jgi:hypothetical protein